MLRRYCEEPLLLLLLRWNLQETKDPLSVVRLMEEVFSFLFFFFFEGKNMSSHEHRKVIDSGDNDDFLFPFSNI